MFLNLIYFCIFIDCKDLFNPNVVNGSGDAEGE